jgi:hypothetical protein
MTLDTNPTYATISSRIAPAQGNVNTANTSICKRRQTQVHKNPETMFEHYLNRLYTPVEHVFEDFVYMHLSGSLLTSSHDILLHIAKIYNIDVDVQKVRLELLCSQLNERICDTVIDAIVYILDQITWTTNNDRTEKRLQQASSIKHVQNASHQYNTIRTRQIQLELGLQRQLTHGEWGVLLKLLLHITFPTFQKDCKELCTQNPCNTGKFLKAIIDESQVEIRNKPLREILCIRKGAIKNAVLGAQGGEGDCYSKIELFRKYVKETFECNI